MTRTHLASPAYLVFCNQEDGANFALTAPLAFRVDEPGIPPIEGVVPPGFATDAASIPRVVRALINQWGKHARAAIVHDFLYAAQPPGFTRHEIDRMFLVLMKLSGVNRLKAYAMWLAVWVFGFVAWNEHKRNRINGIKPV